MRTSIGDWITIGTIAAIGLLVFKNKDTIKSIGSGVNSTVSGALKTVQSKVVKDASKE